MTHCGYLDSSPCDRTFPPRNKVKLVRLKVNVVVISMAKNKMYVIQSKDYSGIMSLQLSQALFNGHEQCR